MIPVITLILILILSIIVYLYFYTTSIPKNFPPGPRPFPIWGSYSQILLENFKFPYLAIHNMAKRYKTNVLGLYFGAFPTVIACDMETIRDVFTKPQFQGRVDAFFPRYRSYGELLGVIFTEGNLWSEQRRFMLRNMRDFGYGRRYDSMEGKFLQDVQDLVDFLRKNNHEICKNGEILVPEMFYVITANTIFSAYAGERKSFEEAYAFSEQMIKQARVLDTTTGALNMTPWMRYFAPGPIGYTVTKQVVPYLQNFVKKLIFEHSDNITDDTAHDFVDRYLQEIRKHMGSENETTFSVKQLEIIGADMLLTGTVTLSFMMGFIILLLAKHRKVQEKCQKEIDEIVGQNRLPTLTDRQNMPYMEATIRECMRYQTLLPLGFPHKAMEDTTLGGYFVPKGSVVMTSLYSLHRDEKVWNDPDLFIPERYISPEGTLIKHDPSLPFGLGKRVCVGETFSRQNIFMIISGLLQNFTFMKPDNKRLPELSENISAVNESPRPFWVKIVPRY